MQSDNQSRYQIDEILEEARRKKQERLSKTLKPSNEFKEKTVSPAKQPVQMRPRFTSSEEILKSEAPSAAHLTNPHAIPDVPVSKPAMVQKPVIAAHNTTALLEKPVAVKPPELDAAQNNLKAVSLTTSEKAAADSMEDVKVYIPKTPKKVQNTDTIILDDHTVKKFRSSISVHPRTTEDDLEQIQMENLPDMPKAFSPNENKPMNPDKDKILEDQVKSERKKKAENFHIHAPATLKLSGDEEANEPNEEPIVFEDEELDDFGSYEEADSVHSELTYRRRMGLAKLILTGLLVLALTGLTVALYILHLSMLNPVLFIGLNVLLLGFAALLNHRIVGDGLSSLFHLRATADSPAGFAVLVVLLHTVLQILNLSAVSDGEAVILAPAAALGLFFSALGKQMRMQRIFDNFKFVSYRSDKYAAKIIDNEKTADEIGRPAVAIGVPVVCYGQKTHFLSHFLESSYQTDSGDRAMRRYVPYILLVSTVVAIVYGYYMHDIMNALTVFTTSICMSFPFGVAAALNFPLLRGARRTLRHGAMAVGPQATEKFGSIHALAVDALDLFPSESVLLHGIKTFSGSRIDEAILDATAVSVAAGGPLSSVFRRVIQSRVDILKKVETLVYEQGMGMTGWVGGRRVLVGNRKLLENHGVDVPSHDYEARYTKSGRQIVYLSTAGELSAMFVVSYTADEGIAKALNAMTSAGITLLVNTCDPNITEELICQEYELDPYYVEVMGAPAGRCFERLTSEESEQENAVMATNGRLEGLAFGVTYCRRLRRASPLAIAVQIIGGALGFALCALVSLYTPVLLPPLFVLAYSSIWVVLSWIFPTIHRV